MANKNSLKPRTRVSGRLKKLTLYGIIGVAVIGISWKICLLIFAGAANSFDVFGMYTPGPGPQISGQQWEKIIIVDHTQVMGSIDLVDFPLLVEMSDPSLRTISNGGLVESSLGHDILFTGANESQLTHQIESYDPATGDLIAWVNLPLLYHDVDTELKVGCGNSVYNVSTSTEATWGSEFEAVWHMTEDPGATDIIDASGDRNAMAYGGMTSSDLILGQIGYAIDMDGSNDYLAIENISFTTPGAINEMTASGWVKTTFNHNSWTANWALLDFDRSEYFNFFVKGDGKISFSTRGQIGGIHDMHGGVSGQVNDGNWHFVAATYDGTDKRLYIDGVLVGTATNPHGGANLGTGTNRFGMIGEGSEASSFNGSRNGIYYKGAIDELRFLSVVRSPEWIATEFNNQSSPGTFFSLDDPLNLSVELVAFDAKILDPEVKLYWVTETERDNDYFSIERSTNAVDFEEIGTLEGSGTTTETMMYDFMDEEPIVGMSYYRLRQVDYDGKFEIHNTVAVNYQPSISACEIQSVYPNPFTSVMNMKFSASKSSVVSISIINTNGNEVFNDQVNTSVGENEYKFQVPPDLKKGIYICRLMQDGNIFGSEKIIKG